MRLERASVRTSVKGCTSSTNLAGNGEVLSFRRLRCMGKGRFKSSTDNSTTPVGHRQRAETRRPRTSIVIKRPHRNAPQDC